MISVNLEAFYLVSRSSFNKPVNMAMSKTTSTYNRANWEDSVRKLEENNEISFLDFMSDLIFIILGVPDSLSNMSWRQSLRSDDKRALWKGM